MKHQDEHELITEARTLAAHKIEDSADGEAVQIMLTLICDRYEALLNAEKPRPTP